jgi:two-component system, chemotaxis family, protein-glutamate methylesterase/glutaminase
MHVLVVDDSAVVRMAVTQILEAQGDVSVATAGDPLIGLRKIENRRPDVILLDLAMPNMDGLTFLRRLMSSDPIPVVVCSALAGEGTQAAIRALEHGAVDVVAKPRLGVRDFLNDSADSLVDTLRAASKARLRIASAPVATEKSPVVVASHPSTTIIAAGASTGGTEAIREFLQRMPANAPPIAIVQHMPEGFTDAFARRLNDLVAMEVREARDGDRFTPGLALIAPGDRHLLVRRRGASYYAELSDGPRVSRHKPSVDALFRSVAHAAGANALGVIMTGMGDDGADGMLDLRQNGAYTLAQNEATCTVFGMPKEAIARGGVHSVLPLQRLADAALAFTSAIRRNR